MSSFFSKKGPNLQFTKEELDFNSAPIRTKKIILVGLSGSGKSSVSKAFNGRGADLGADGLVAMTFRRMTNNVVVSEGNKISFQGHECVLDVFDTVGFGDSEITFATILRQIVERLARDLNEINKVVFCFRMDRLRSKVAEELKNAYSFFKLLGAKPENFLICITFTDFYNESTIRKFVEEMVATAEFDWIEKDKLPITYLAFPNLSELDTDENLVKYIHTLIRQSSYRLLQHVVVSKEEKFFPHQNLIHLETAKITMFAKMLEQEDAKRRSLWNFFSWGSKPDVSYSKVVEEMRRMKGMPDDVEGHQQSSGSAHDSQKPGPPGGGECSA